MQDDLLAVELLIDKHIQIVLFLLNVDGDIDACAIDRDMDRLGVVLVLEEQSELLGDFSELHRDKSELDFSAAVTVDFSRAFEADLGKELIKNVGLGWDVIVLDVSTTSSKHVGLKLLVDQVSVQ